MWTPPSLADPVWSDNEAVVAAAIAAGVDAHAIAPTAHRPPVHLAIEHQRIGIVQRLIPAGAEINRDLGQGRTPLMHAIDIESDAPWQAHHEIGHESTELTELLLAGGAVPTPKAFEVAEGYDNQKAVALRKRSSDHTE